MVKEKEDTPRDGIQGIAQKVEEKDTLHTNQKVKEKECKDSVSTVVKPDTQQGYAQSQKEKAKVKEA